MREYLLVVKSRSVLVCYFVLLAAFHRRPHDNDILLRSAIPAQLKGLRNGITSCTMTSALPYLFSNGAKPPRPESEGSCVFDGRRAPHNAAAWNEAQSVHTRVAGSESPFGRAAGCETKTPWIAIDSASDMGRR